ncbi:MAG: alanine--tRNA ligase [bacterium]
MKSDEIREKFLKFFEEKGHKRLPSSSLLPENDPTVLFTTAGMQQFKRFYKFPDEAPSSRITTCQKCVRTGDIDEVGDETHLTFFEMLGNFSFGYETAVSDQQSAVSEGKQTPYFKQEAIEWAWEFLIEELEIDPKRIFATYFEGEEGVSEDVESLDILKKIEGLEEIRPQGFGENFWSLGTEGSPGGPTIEFYVDDVEVWNLVFNEYVLKGDKYEPSEFKGVDTGMGFERIVAVMQEKSDVYQTDLFEPIIKKLEELSGKKYSSHCHSELGSESRSRNEFGMTGTQTRNDVRTFRIVADHIKSAVFMIADGVEPSNKGQGYILRRLIRRAVVKARNLKINENFCGKIAAVIPTSPSVIPTKVEGSLDIARDDILKVLDKEESKFRKTLDDGLKLLSVAPRVGGHLLFNLMQTYGLPYEVAIEEAKNLNLKIENQGEIREDFEKLFAEHQQKSRTASSGMFKGGLADNKIETTRLHTTAHLLLAALRHELGEHIEQKGSNITEERLRFDFNYSQKLTDEQIKKVEDLVNLKIEEALPVVMQELSIDEAKKSGATGVFWDKYGPEGAPFGGDTVKIFTVGDPAEPFSREICGGPHVQNTSELGHFCITKEESSSSGIRRIKAVLE